MTMLNPALESLPGVTLARANIRRPDDGSMADLVRTSVGIYATLQGGVMRTIDQAVAARLADPRAPRVGDAETAV